MPNIEINQLYNQQRFPGDSYSGYKFILLLLYLPFGLIFLVLRLLLGLQVYLLGCILPDTPFIRKILSKLICVTLGIIIYAENPDQMDDVPVYISNQVSYFDPLVVHCATGCVMPGSSKLNRLLSSACGTIFLGSTSNLDTFKKNISIFIAESSTPLYFQPECKITNGETLLKFKEWPFTLSRKVQPVSIQVNRPIMSISIATLDSNYWLDVFFYLFSPVTCYNLKYVSVSHKQNLSAVEFAEKVRLDIAASLKVRASDYSATEVLEWEKRFHSDRQRIIASHSSNQSSSSTESAELHQMARQVREVLPTVPYNVIYKDLAKTRSTDHTITNILEGQVQYVPEPIQVSPSTSCESFISSLDSMNSASTSASFEDARPEPLSTAAPIFGKSAQERTLSFQERKESLIQNARKRYLEKQSLLADKKLHQF